MTDKYRAQVDALSDAFESTFTLLEPGLLVNFFHVTEAEKVKALVKHYMEAESVELHKDPEFKDDDYALWHVRYK